MIATVRTKTGHPVRLSGYAQDFGQAITAVEFSANEGASWTTYPVKDADELCNVNWSFDFTPPEPGISRIFVRSVRLDGTRTPEPALVTIDAAF